MVSCISSRLSVRSHLTTCVTGLCVVFAAEKKRKISMIPPWCHAVSSTHVCYYFCLLCTVKQPSQGLAVFDLGLTAHRRSPRPDTTPPPSDVKLRPAGPLWLYRRRTADKTQGWVVPLLQICHWLPPPPTNSWTWTRSPRRTTTADATSARLGLAAILFSQLLHPRLV